MLLPDEMKTSMKTTKALFGLLTITAVLAVHIQAQTSNLITTLEMQFTSAQNLTTPVLPVSGQYFFLVTGRYGTGPGDRGEAMADAAYTTFIQTTLDQTHNSGHWWQWNGSMTNRPTPDVYQTNHLYRFDFTGRGVAEVLTFIDGGAYGDNVGTLTFQLYQTGPLVNLIRAVKPSFSNLMLTTNYQLQVSGDLSSWTNQGSAFTATNTSMVYPQYWDVENWDQLYFRLQAAQ